METAQGVFGLLALVGVACLFSENRRKIPWKTVGYAILLQLLLAVVLLKIAPSRHLFLFLNTLINSLQEALQKGTAMVFGYLGGAPLPFKENGADSYILAFRGLPMILLASAISSLLFYWRILPRIVRGFSWLLRRTLGVGGAEGLANAANIFIGMVEAPLFIRPYISKLTRGELFSVMTCGMATIAGTVMVLYAGVLGPVIPDAMGHLLTASIISAPAAIALARIMVPTVQGEETDADMVSPAPADSAMEAITNGTLEGIKLVISVIAMLVVLVSLVGFVNIGLGLLPKVGGSPLTLQRMLGLVMSPIMWLIGIPWHECATAGSLMGTKTVLNELLAYLEMAGLSPETLSERTRLILTYAMCGFANPGSLGIMLGGLGAMAPDRRAEIVSLGTKSILAGTLATCMTGTIVGILTAF
jgi:CNT family concentrative nucleoside transporter